MKLPNWISNLTHPPSWIERRGLRQDCESWPTLIPLKLPPTLPHIKFRELGGKLVTIEMESEPGLARKDIVLQLSLDLPEGSSTTPEVCCYPCDGNCLEVFNQLPVEAKCVRPPDLNLAFRKHFGDVE